MFNFKLGVYGDAVAKEKETSTEKVRSSTVAATSFHQR